MTKLEVLNQPLYGNSNIVFNGKPIFSPNFAQSGIHKVRDIWDCETNNFKDSNFIFNSLIDKRNWISQWTKLKKAITGDLKNILNENESNVSPSNQNLKPFKLQETYKICDKKNKLLTNKDISMRKLKVIFNIDIEPICQNKWNIYFNKNLMWRKIWRNLRINRATRKANQLSWKIIYNTVYTEAKLQKMGRSMNGLCHFCNT